MKQLQDINTHGEYTVSTSQDPVSLEIKSDDPHIISKKLWTLNDLLEIESKLVLITRQKSKWADDKLDFQEVCIINKLKLTCLKFNDNFFVDAC